MWKLLNWIDVEQLSWSALSENPKALNLLQDNQNKIVWSYLCRNINVDAIRLLESNLDKLIWKIGRFYLGTQQRFTCLNKI